MKKLVLFLLAGILILSAAASAYAVYDRYQLVTGDAVYAFSWHVYPLDAHNAVITAVSYDDRPWHVTWYRDGENSGTSPGWLRSRIWRSGSFRNRCSGTAST